VVEVVEVPMSEAAREPAVWFSLMIILFQYQEEQVIQYQLEVEDLVLHQQVEDLLEMMVQIALLLV
jgi:hypothetical protein